MKLTEIIFRPNRRIYHLDLTPEEIAPTVFLTGDPERIDQFEQLLHKVEIRRHNREYRSVTGIRNGHRVTFLSTGIGTDNIEIATIEMDALARQRRCWQTYQWIRLGTSGAIHADIHVGQSVLSTYAMGLDNLHCFYPPTQYKDEWIIESQLKSYLTEKGISLWPYVIKASPTLSQRLRSSANIEGITVCAPGFFAPQGRALPINHPFQNLPDQLTNFECNGLRILNFEMEVSALYLMARTLGHHAAVVDIIIANRANGNTLLDYQPYLMEIAAQILDTLD